MGTNRQLCLALASTACQIACTVFTITFSFYVASLVLTPVRILGITQLPPGIAYTDNRF